MQKALSVNRWQLCIFILALGYTTGKCYSYLALWPSCTCVCLCTRKVCSVYGCVCVYLCVCGRWKVCNSPSEIGESLDLAVMEFVSDTARDMDRVGEDLGTGEDT